MRQYRAFMNYKEAAAFCATLEREGVDCSIVTNTPRPGQFTVNYGEGRTDWPSFADMVRADDERQRMLNEARERELLGMGRMIAARAAATEAGLVDRDAEVFADGFCGVPAKLSNPRAEGREAIFRRGRHTYMDPRWQAAARAAAAAARKSVPREHAVPLREGGLIANGEYD